VLRPTTAAGRRRDRQRRRNAVDRRRRGPRFGDRPEPRGQPGQGRRGTATNTLLNWATVVPTAGLALDGSKAFEVAGRLAQLNVADVLSGSADFSIARSTVTNSVVTNGTLLVVDITNLVAGATGGGFDLTLTAGALKVATLNAPQSPTDKRTWTGIEIVNGGATLSIADGVVRASVTGLNLAVNQAKDAAGAATNTLLNWATNPSRPPVWRSTGSKALRSRVASRS
jgi:hypothetical protein